jgi:Zn-dependent membrane protease YugP
VDGLLIWLNRIFELNPVALGLFLAGIGLTCWARSRVDAALATAARVASRRRTTGAEAAEEILDATDLGDVAVVRARGPLADYYDPATRTIRLGASAFGGHSLASLALAAHEAGHAIQHARRDPPFPLAIRDGVALASRLGPAASSLTALVGFLLGVPDLTTLGLVAFGLTSALPLLGLPIERDASRRARRALAMTALVDSGQDALVAEVLDAVTWSTVAAGLPRFRAPTWRRLTPEEVPA